MGAYTCEYGIVHKVCRCPEPHTIKCNVPKEHLVKSVDKMPYTTKGTEKCYRFANGLVGKHEHHPAHDFFYTSSMGGHYMDTYDPIRDKNERNVAKHRCPGNECDG